MIKASTMSSSIFSMINYRFLKTVSTEKFSEVFVALEHCDQDDQKRKIEEMNEVVNDLNEKEFQSVFTTELFNKMEKMIAEKKLSLEKVNMLLKCAGSCKMLKYFRIHSFDSSSLPKRFGDVIVEEDKKKDEKDEKFLADLCRCYLMMHDGYCKLPEETIPIFVTCLLKVALNKEEDEETQKEVEMTLLALCNIKNLVKIKKELYLKDVKQIILYHQVHHNLTRLAYQLAWQFLMNRLFDNDDLKDIVANKLRFVDEATKELTEMTKCGDLNKKEKEGIDKMDIDVIERWLSAILLFGSKQQLYDEEFIGLSVRIVDICRAMKEDEQIIFRQCATLFHSVARKEAKSYEVLLKAGVFDFFLEEIQQPTLKFFNLCCCLRFYILVSSRLEEKGDKEYNEFKWNKIKSETKGILEEEGYEDLIISFCEILSSLHGSPFLPISEDLEQYFVNA